MHKYIEEDLLKMAIEAEPYFTDSTKAAFRNIANKVPAADVVAVVRCKDCEHYVDCGTYYRIMDCTHPNGLNDPEEDYFCPHGERRGEDGTA